MRRRSGLALLAGLALLLAPVAPTVVAPHHAGPGHAEARAAPVDGHPFVAHAVTSAQGRARRDAHRPPSVPAGPAATTAGIASAEPLVGARPAAASSTDLPSSSRPRAPPAVV